MSQSTQTAIIIIIIILNAFLLERKENKILENQSIIITRLNDLSGKKQTLTEVQCIGVEPALNMIIEQQSKLIQNQQVVNNLLNLK